MSHIGDAIIHDEIPVCKELIEEKPGSYIYSFISERKLAKISERLVEVAIQASFTARHQGADLIKGCRSFPCVALLEVPMLLTAPSVQFIFAGPENLAAIGEFLQELGGPYFKEKRFPKATAQDYYNWKYFGNPLVDAVVALAFADDRLVGTLAAMPKPLHIGGRRLLAYELGDFLTASDFRKRGLGSQLIKMIDDEIAGRDAALLYAQPNDNSFPLFLKFGFVEPRRILQRHYAIPSHVLARRLHMPPVLIRWTGIDQTVRRLATPPTSDRRVTVERISAFDAETDRIWQGAREDYAFVLERKHEFLNWRYVDSPTPFQIWLARRDNKPSGFLVGFASAEDKLAEIVDLFTASSDRIIGQALLNRAFRELHQQGIQAILAYTISDSQQSIVGRLLHRACPLVRQKPLHFVVRCFDSTVLDRLALSGWHLSPGDFDGI